MKNTKNKMYSLILSFVIVILLCSCPIINNNGSEYGTLEIDIENMVSRSIQPDHKEISSYRISGTGPNGITFNSINSTETHIEIPNLLEGTWSIKVEALNSESVIIGSKQKDIEIDGPLTIRTFNLEYLSGNGIFDLSIKYPEYMTFIDSVTVKLSLNSSQVDNSTLDSDTAITTGGDSVISKQYSTLNSNLYDIEIIFKDDTSTQIGENLIDEVNIIKGLTTNGEFVVDSSNIFGEQEIYAPSRNDLVGFPTDHESFFGTSISIDEDTAVICDNYDVGEDHYGLEIGSAHIFERNNTNGNWSETVRLTPKDTDSQNKDLFGYSSCISGDRIIVGAPDHDTTFDKQEGCAFIFTRNTQGEWDDGVIIKADSVVEYDRFGSSVAINGDIAMVGTKNATPDLTANHGTVYIYQYNSLTESWDFVSKLVGSDTEYSFGQSLAMNDEICIAGGSDFAYIIEQDVSDNWIKSTKLDPNDIDSTSHEFGVDVDISDNAIIIGAPSINNSYAGRAYIYNLSDLSVEIRIGETNATTDMNFGSSVAISDKYAVIGDYTLEDDDDIQTGGCFIYIKDGSTWNKISELYSTDKTLLNNELDCFANDICIDEDNLLVAAYKDDYNNTNTGSVYAYELP